ncbi:MAG: hypothetical protein EOP49_35030 [Sphingobacteriales bacterium]|nr:MAG: hypothetical protein EOP49_35030 [Sphingobacteriales bacterium]
MLPLAALTTVYAVSNNDTFSAIPNPITGYYRMSGLPSGSYDVWMDAGSGSYQDTLINNVQVTYGTETNLGTLTLQP